MCIRDRLHTITGAFTALADMKLFSYLDNLRNSI